MYTNGKSQEHGTKVVKFRLECEHHWWNFETYIDAENGAKELIKDCKATITKIEEYWDRDCNLVDKEKEKLQ